MSKKNNIELKKAEVRKMEQKRRKNRNMKIAASSAFILIAIISIVIFISMSDNPNTDIQKSEPANDSNIISGTEVSLPISDISNNAKFYSYESDGIEIKYFAVKGADDDIHVALDTCDVCYNEKKGYRQIGDVMHCINCGREFNINSIGTSNTAGGCWPSYLPWNIKNDDIIIKISDLESKRYMFV